MLKTFFVTILAITAFSTINAQDSTFTLTGTVTGIADKTEVKLISSTTNEELVKTEFAGGKFVLKGKLPEPSLYFLNIAGEDQQYIYLENSNITVTAKKGEMKKMQVRGSQSHTEFLNFQATFNPLVEKVNSSAIPLRTAPEGPKRDSLMAAFNSTMETVKQKIDQVVDQRPASYVTPFILYVTYPFYEDPVLLEQRFARLDNKIRTSNIGISLSQYINYYKVGAVGTEAVDFSQPDTTGTPISLSSFRGKYVLVDFWASWCGPCRLENPNVVANYNKFKNKNFTVFGVSLEKPGQRDAWIQAIKHDQLNWTHVSDMQHWNNAAAQLYHVQGIPFNLLIDPNGKIVAKNLRGPDLERKLCELIGCN